MTLAVLRATAGGVSIPPRIAIVRMGENTREAARYAAIAEAASIVAAGAANYFSTIAAGIAGTAVGGAFSSNEGGALKLYERTGTSPFYVEIAELDGDLRVDLAAPTGAALIGVEQGGTVQGFIENSNARLENKAALRNLTAELYEQGVTPRLFTVLTVGDSVGPRVGEHIAIGLRERYGDGGTVQPVQSGTADYGSDTVLYASTGTVAQGDVADASYPYLPNNKHWVMSNGSTLTFRARAAGHSTFSRIMAWLVKRPGDGSALLEVCKISDNSVVASWNTGSLDGVDGTLVKANAGAHFTGLDSTIPYYLRVTATGNVCFLTALFARDSGVILYQAGLGGSPISKQLPALQGAAWQGIVSDLNVRLMLHEDKTEDAGASYDALMAAWQAMPNVAGVFIGSLPDSTTPATQVALSALLRTKALAAGYAFIDGYAAMKDYTEVTRLGLNNDGTHLLTAAYWSVANAVLAELYLDDPRLPVLGKAVHRASEYSISRTDGFGNSTLRVRYAGWENGLSRVNLWNVNALGLKSNSTEATDAVTAQVRLLSYSNFGVAFLSAAGGAAYLVNVGGIHLGTQAGTGGSSGKIEPNYNSWRLKFTLTNGAGSTTKDATLECGGLRVGGIDMLTAQQTGWTAGTGTANKGAFAAYAGATMSAAYVQAEAQATNDAVKNASQRVKALEDALRSLGLIN